MRLDCDRVAGQTEECFQGEGGGRGGGGGKVGSEGKDEDCLYSPPDIVFPLIGVKLSRGSVNTNNPEADLQPNVVWYCV